MKVCSFTGHRQIKREHLHDITDLLDRAVEYTYRSGCRRFLAGGAVGFDTLAARAVIKFRISHPDVSLVLVLPCIDQGKCWSERQLASYEYTVAEADEIIYISDEYTDDCMKIRNRRLAEDADVVIAYVNRYNSGAAQTVRMAKACGKEVYNLYPSLENKN